MLMLLHQRMSLSRKLKKLTYKQIRVSGSLERVTKRIASVQKIYAKKISRMQSNMDMQIKMAQAQAKNWQAQAFGSGSIFGYGFGTQSYMTPFMQNIISGMINEPGKGMLPGSRFEQIFGWMQNGYQWKADKDDPNKGKINDQDVTKEEYERYQQQMQFAQYRQQMTQQNIQNWCDEVQRVGQMQKEAMEEQLEAEQEEMLAPLRDMETEYDCDKTATEAQIELVKAELETVKSELAQSAKDTAPKFGLA